MQIFRSRVAVSLAALAVFSVSASPVLARGRDDWRPHRHYRGGGISGGDLLAGLLVVGGIAAIASAASKNSSDDRASGQADEPEPYRYPGGPEAGGDAGYGDAPAGEGPASYPGGPAVQGSFGAAVDACSAELERGGKAVDSVDSVRRMGERYSVDGRLQDGRPYACSVDETGHIRSVAVDGHGMI
ncbi:hypothetical protein [Novosphingobium resinovorum]|uniref:hypothetical protein n=1 Tax=Novosphingobium resinovorum TaxID=158500 RepID=UPI002ED0B887|nr:hypothetical protein [Novosphingobium resinovorum]